MKILDATAGLKGIWYQKDHPFVTFMDHRYINGSKQKTSNNIKNRRVIRIKPDVVAEWKDTPFPDNYFDMVVFDPPHMIRNKKCDHIFVEKYGMLHLSNYKQVKYYFNKIIERSFSPFFIILSYYMCIKSNFNLNISIVLSMEIILILLISLIVKPINKKIIIESNLINYLEEFFVFLSFILILSTYLKINSIVIFIIVLINLVFIEYF